MFSSYTPDFLFRSHRRTQISNLDVGLCGMIQSRSGSSSTGSPLATPYHPGWFRNGTSLAGSVVPSRCLLPLGVTAYDQGFALSSVEDKELVPSVYKHRFVSGVGAGDR
jgi:hypothetical protein